MQRTDSPDDTGRPREHRRDPMKREYVMASRFKVRPLPLAVLGALVACLTFAVPGYAQGNKKAAEQQKKLAEEQKKVLEEQKKLGEAELVKQAYVLLATANANYAGHRGHAMAHLEKAANILDKNLTKKGTEMQKAKAALDDRVAALAKLGDKVTPPTREVQIASDAQLQKALVLLKQAQAAITSDKHKEARGHVDGAMTEIVKALAVR
jgi:hypothetical protein